MLPQVLGFASGRGPERCGAGAAPFGAIRKMWGSTVRPFGGHSFLYVVHRGAPGSSLDASTGAGYRSAAGFREIYGDHSEIAITGGTIAAGGSHYACQQARGPCGFWWSDPTACACSSERGYSVKDVNILASHPRPSGASVGYSGSSSRRESEAGVHAISLRRTQRAARAWRLYHPSPA